MKTGHTYRFLCGRLLESSHLEDQTGDMDYKINIYPMEMGCKVCKWTGNGSPQIVCINEF